MFVGVRDKRTDATQAIKHSQSEKVENRNGKEDLAVALVSTRIARKGREGARRKFAGDRGLRGYELFDRLGRLENEISLKDTRVRT